MVTSKTWEEGDAMGWSTSDMIRTSQDMSRDCRTYVTTLHTSPFWCFGAKNSHPGWAAKPWTSSPSGSESEWEGMRWPNHGSWTITMSAEVAWRKAMNNGFQRRMLTDTIDMGVSIIVTMQGRQAGGRETLHQRASRHRGWGCSARRRHLHPSFPHQRSHQSERWEIGTWIRGGRKEIGLSDL